MTRFYQIQKQSTTIVAGALALLIAAKSLPTASAANICPASYAPVSTFSVTAAASSDSAVGCTIGQDAVNTTVFTIDARGIPTGSGASQASTVVFRDGTVKPRSAISVLCPLQSTSAGLIPIIVEVTGTLFETGAGLQIWGSLPPASRVLISGNTFNVAASSSLPPWFSSVFAGIALAPHNVDVLQAFGANAAVSIEDNTINGIGDLSTTRSTLGISWRGGVQYGAGASAQITANRFEMSCASVLNQVLDMQACVVGVHMMATQFFQQNGASLAVDENNFQITGGVVAAMPPIDSSAGVGSLVSFSGNSGSATTTGAVGDDVITFGTMTVSSDLMSIISNNDFTVTGTTACSFGFGPHIPVEQIFGMPPSDSPSVMSGSARVVVALNTIGTNGCDAQILFDRDHTLSGSARFLINDNTMTRTGEGSGAAVVENHNALTLQDSGVLSLARNSWDCTVRPSSDVLMGFGLSSGSVSGAVGSIRACGNSLNGAALDTDAEVQGKCSATIAAVISSNACMSEDGSTETVQNTLTTTSNTSDDGSTTAEPSTTASPPSTVSQGSPSPSPITSTFTSANTTAGQNTTTTTVPLSTSTTAAGASSESNDTTTAAITPTSSVATGPFNTTANLVNSTNSISTPKETSTASACGVGTALLAALTTMAVLGYLM